MSLGVAGVEIDDGLQDKGRQAEGIDAQ